jgi:hypothetical protein
MPSWISDGEKFALLGLAVQIERAIPFRRLGADFWVSTDERLSVPDRWREWLGTIRAEQIEGCNLVVLSKTLISATPIFTVAPIFDGENDRLLKNVSAFYVALLICSEFTPAHEPMLLSGACHDGVVDLKRQSSLNTPSQNLFRHFKPIAIVDVERAALLTASYQTLLAHQPVGDVRRILRAVQVYCDARPMQDILDRLHQYCRCIDGLIFSAQGNGRNQFKSRTELFIGPREHPLMDQIYTIRSDVEHLHEHKYLENFDRAVRLDLVQKEAIAEHIARNALAHIVGTPHLWSHFGNTRSLDAFWNLPPADKRAIWGPPTIRVADALVDYDPQYIRDDALGRQQ